MGKIKNNIQLIKEKILWGGSGREAILIKLLLKYYKSKIYRDWGLSTEHPHFFDQQAGFFITGYDKKPTGFYGFTRGFNAAEIIADGDVLLDIGCGDGFFTKRFFSVKCSHIDAIDIEPSAIQAGKKYNNDKKINYVLSDAIASPFPRTDYNVIVWDGAIAHFAGDTIQTMLLKIKKGLKQGGVFVGSEALGLDAGDHLQVFPSLEKLSLLFRPHFRHVALKSVKYEIPGNLIREEAYWRCSDSLEKITDWKYFNS